jgi:hypothetical protein
VVGAPAELATLLQSSTLKPEACAAIVLAWLDTISSRPKRQPLENLFTELPKEGARLVLASAMSPAMSADRALRATRAP